MHQDPSISQDPLYRFWHRSVYPASEYASPDKADWNEQMIALSAFGRGTEEALHFLYRSKPDFNGFVEWAKLTTPEPISDPEAGAPPLTSEDMDFWNKNGYLVIRNAIPADQCAAARDAIWDFLGASPQYPETWYRDHDGKKGMMLAFFQHPALARIRQSVYIRRCYEQLYGTKDIYLLIDKVSFNPPENNEYTFLGSPLHWDVSLAPPIPFELQGLLYLNDVNADEGAFHCVPGFHHKVDDWLTGLPAGSDPRQIVLQTMTPVAVPASAGDLVVWHQALPHCATANKGTTPRMVQYLAYKPLCVTGSSEWI